MVDPQELEAEWSRVDPMSAPNALLYLDTLNSTD